MGPDDTHYPSFSQDPIGLGILEDPVFTSDGMTYERRYDAQATGRTNIGVSNRATGEMVTTLPTHTSLTQGD